MQLLLVFLGSGFGGVLRYALSQWLNGTYPFGTIAANVIGCFFIGLLSHILPTDNHSRLLLITGFCGGFTTFSTFINENLLYMRSGQLFLALVYMAISLILGTLAAYIGIKILN